jgi:hypothetical protein
MQPSSLRRMLSDWWPSTHATSAAESALRRGRLHAAVHVHQPKTLKASASDQMPLWLIHPDVSCDCSCRSAASAMPGTMVRISNCPVPPHTDSSAAATGHGSISRCLP